MDNDTLQELKLSFFNDGFQLAENNLKDGIHKTSIIRLVSETYSYIDSFIEQFLVHCENEKSVVDCKKGCAYCCHQSVFILPQEAFYMYLYLKIQGNKELYSLVKERVIIKNSITSSLRVDEIIRHNKPCPLLVDNICSVYEVRPMACRLFLSMNVQSCITERENPSDFNKIARLYDIPLHVGRMLNEGVCAFLSEKGLKPQEWFLESALNQIFSDEKSFFKWIEGENTFQPREIADEEWEYLKKFDLK